MQPPYSTTWPASAVFNLYRSLNTMYVLSRVALAGMPQAGAFICAALLSTRPQRRHVQVCDVRRHSQQPCTHRPNPRPNILQYPSLEAPITTEPYLLAARHVQMEPFENFPLARWSVLFRPAPRAARLHVLLGETRQVPLSSWQSLGRGFRRQMRYPAA